MKFVHSKASIFAVLLCTSVPAFAVEPKSLFQKICHAILTSPETDQSFIAKLQRKALRHVDLGISGVAKKGYHFVVWTAKSRLALKDVQKVGLGIRIKDHAPVIQNRGGTIELGDDILFESPVTPTHFAVEKGAVLKIGNDTYFNDGVWIGVTESVTIGARVKVGPGVRIMDNNYHDTYERSKMPKAKPVVIEDDVWIASDSMIMPGVTIGRGSIVGAHTLVTKDVPEFTVVAGNPAYVVRQLDPTKLIIRGSK